MFKIGERVEYIREKSFIPAGSTGTVRVLSSTHIGVEFDAMIVRPELLARLDMTTKEHYRLHGACTPGYGAYVLRDELRLSRRGKMPQPKEEGRE